ncbi:MAG TPA: DUF2802 domain-containing protein [Steroidobacteraceae bacterium]|nr:DUF2802 domain-containing protein [Steroidobacteraceae bacterium]
MIQTAAHHAAATLAATPLFGYVLVPPPDYILIPATGLVIILAGALVTTLFALRLKRSAIQQGREIRAGSAFLADQIEQLQAALAVADTRVAALAARLDEQSRATQSGSSASYNVAIRMARSGASRQELVSACGVTQQEADLVLRLHAAGPTTRSAA